MDSVAAARRSLYSIDGVSAEERFTNVVRVKLISTGMKPMQIEVDLSDWRSDHELADREAVSRSVVQITERLGSSRREDDVDAYRLLIELAPEYFKEWTRREGLRSEEGHVGKEGVSTCRSRGTQYHTKKKIK